MGERATNPIYRTAAWRAVRRRVLDRDGRSCQIGLSGCLGVATAVDHVIELQDGGEPFAPENLVACCMPCNTAKRNRRVAQKARGGLRQW